MCCGPPTRPLARAAASVVDAAARKRAAEPLGGDGDAGEVGVAEGGLDEGVVVEALRLLVVLGDRAARKGIPLFEQNMLEGGCRRCLAARSHTSSSSTCRAPRGHFISEKVSRWRPAPWPAPPRAV